MIFVNDMDLGDKQDDPLVFTLQVRWTLPPGPCVRCRPSDAIQTVPLGGQGSQRRFRFRCRSEAEARSWRVAIREAKLLGGHACRCGLSSPAWVSDKHFKCCDTCRIVRPLNTVGKQVRAEAYRGRRTPRVARRAPAPPRYCAGEPTHPPRPQSFSAGTRKHHCRCCGRLFCSSCSGGPKLRLHPYPCPVRCCDACGERQRVTRPPLPARPLNTPTFPIALKP